LIGMFGPPLAEVALLFGAPEYFSLMLFSLTGAAVLVHGSMLKALGMIVLGVSSVASESPYSSSHGNSVVRINGLIAKDVCR
jgi:hypothetical protein